MHESNRRSLLLACPALALLGVLSPAAAQTPAGPLTLDGLSSLVANMGYDVKQNGSGKPFSITVNGEYPLTITFNMASPGANILAYIFLQRFTPAERKRLNMTALLQSNDIWESYFSLSGTGDDLDLYIQRPLPAVAATPAAMRVLIENLQKVTYSTGNLWDKAKWATQ